MDDSPPSRQPLSFCPNTISILVHQKQQDGRFLKMGSMSQNGNSFLLGFPSSSKQRVPIRILCETPVACLRLALWKVQLLAQAHLLPGMRRTPQDGPHLFRGISGKRQSVSNSGGFSCWETPNQPRSGMTFNVPNDLRTLQGLQGLSLVHLLST